MLNFIILKFRNLSMNLLILVNINLQLIMQIKRKLNAWFWDSLWPQLLRKNINIKLMLSFVYTEAKSFEELLTTQPTLLRLLPHLGLDVETGMDALCLGGIILAFVAMLSRTQRNCIVFGFLWVFYLSLFQVMLFVLYALFIHIDQILFGYIVFYLYLSYF